MLSPYSSVLARSLGLDILYTLLQNFLCSVGEWHLIKPANSQEPEGIISINAYSMHILSVEP